MPMEKMDKMEKDKKDGEHNADASAQKLAKKRRKATPDHKGHYDIDAASFDADEGIQLGGAAVAASPTQANPDKACKKATA